MTCKRRQPRALTPCLLALALLLCAAGAAAKPRVRIGNDLDDVVDSEETPDWKEWGKHKVPKKIEQPSEDALKQGFKQLQLSIVTVDAALVKLRHGKCKTMLTKWTAMLAEAGLRGKHVTFEPAGESEDDIIVRYGEEQDFTGLVLEFLFRQDEVLSALVKGQSVSKAQFWATHPELLQDEL